MPRPRPIRTPLRQRLEDLRRTWLPILVWGGAVWLCVLGLERRSASPDFRGVARAASHRVAAERAGRVEAVLVDLYDDVEAGAALVLLDDGELQAQLAASRAEVDRLADELDAARERLAAEAADAESDRLSRLRRFRVDEEELRVELLELEVELEGDRRDRERIAARLERAATLADQGVGSGAEEVDLELRRAGLDAVIGRREALAAELAASLASASGRRRAYELEVPAAAAGDALLRPLAEAVRVQELRLAELRLQADGLILRAPIAGRVQSLPAGGTGVLQPGEPAAVITDPRVFEVVAYLPEGAARGLGATTRLELSLIHI